MSYLHSGDSSGDSEVVPLTAKFKIKDALGWKFVIQESVEMSKMHDHTVEEVRTE